MTISFSLWIWGNDKNMKVKLSEEKYLTITRLNVQRVLFYMLSAAMAGAVCKLSVPGGKAAISKLDSDLQRVYFDPDKPLVQVYVGDTFDEVPLTDPPNLDVSYTWELMDDGILTVSDGKIIAVKEGETTVGVSAGDFYDEVDVYVTYKHLPTDSTLPPVYYEKLMIANYNHTLDSDYIPENLIQIPAEYVAENYWTLYVCEETFEKYKELLSAMQAELGSTNMHILSAYRSYVRQSELYNNAVQSYIAQGKSSVEARSLALNTTQMPGNSEHQLGNTIDVSNGYDTDHQYQETPEGAWLAENAHKYGFIIRYPADKEDITRIEYEPWHIRYVGVYHATYMYVNNVCLEEYIELQQEAEEAANAFAEARAAYSK